MAGDRQGYARRLMFRGIGCGIRFGMCCLPIYGVAFLGGAFFATAFGGVDTFSAFELFVKIPVYMVGICMLEAIKMAGGITALIGLMGGHVLSTILSTAGVIVAGAAVGGICLGCHKLAKYADSQESHTDRLAAERTDPQAHRESGHAHAS